MDQANSISQIQSGTYRVHALLVMALLLWLSGCAATQQRSTSTEEATTQRPVVRPVVAPENNNAGVESAEQSDSRPEKTTTRNPAVVALRTQADSALKDDDIPAATRLLERALRIDPKDAETYYAVAQLRIKQDQPDAALQLIDKALSLRPDPDLTTQLESLRESATTPSE